MSSQQPCSPLSRATEQRSSPAARHQCNETRAMSNDATRETEQKNLDLLGNHRQVARCKSVCAAGEGIRRRWRGGRDRKLSHPRREVRSAPPEQGRQERNVSLEAERRGNERNKKKSIQTQEFRLSDNKNFLTKTEMDSGYFFQRKRVQQLQSIAHRLSGLRREETQVDEAYMAAALD